MRRTVNLFVATMTALLLAQSFVAWGGRLDWALYQIGLLLIIVTFPLLGVAFVIRAISGIYEAYVTQRGRRIESLHAASSTMVAPLTDL